MSQDDSEIQKIVQQQWDWIVVGTGMGGGTFGFDLARRGKRVLFLERGKNTDHTPRAHRKEFVETLLPHFETISESDRAVLQNGGRFSHQIEDRSTTQVKKFVPYIGEGVGGSTLIYGAILERFAPEDFSSSNYYPINEPGYFPLAWPFSFESFVPYYEQAEILFRPKLIDLNSTTTSLELKCSFEEKGLSPTGMHVAHEPMATEHSCQGALCNDFGKRGSKEVCVDPAISNYEAKLIDRCTVHSIITSRSQVTGVKCLRNGKVYTINARNIALGAGALETPALLLRSSSEAWPRGIGNQNDLVGRGLMRHYIDLYFVRPKDRRGLYEKAILIRDFLFKDGLKLGVLHAFGPLPDTRVMANELLSNVPLYLRRFFHFVLNLLFKVISRKYAVLATIMEDRPAIENRVGWDREKNCIWINYKIGPTEMVRIKKLRKYVIEAIGGFKWFANYQAQDNKRIAHICGTCRLGNDSATSVLDIDCRVHGTENLFVVDASCLPGSGSINPALTIAANALRVAEKVSQI